MSNLVKYPRTPHLPWSAGAAQDDKVLKDTAHFTGKHVLVTEKLDGENTTLYRDHIHARSLDSGDHWSRHWLKGFWAGIRNEIPEGWRVCGENLYATHSIEYDWLPSYFLGFSVWNADNVCLPWQETEDFLSHLNIETPQVIWEGIYREATIRDLWSIFGSDYIKDFALDNAEGYIIRNIGDFDLDQFQSSVAKFVRAGHVQTDEHWMHRADRRVNRLRNP